MSLQMVKAWWYELFSMNNDFTILSLPIALNRNYGAVTMEWFSFRLRKWNSKLSNLPSFLVYFQTNMSIYYIKMDVVVTFVLYDIIVLWNYFCALGHRVSFLYMIFETSFVRYSIWYPYINRRIIMNLEGLWNQFGVLLDKSSFLKFYIPISEGNQNAVQTLMY